MTLSELKKTFKNKELFTQALTHKSWVNENPGVRNSNERLEFLGDAVLDLIVAEHLFNVFPQKPEGYLSALRSNIVNTINLSKIAREMEIGKYLFLSKGEELSGRESSSLLEDTIEAIIGAIYLDQGIDKARDFIQINILADLKQKVKEPLKDPKSSLQEKLQSEGLFPQYKVVKITGPEHNHTFTIEVWVGKKMLGKGSGKKKGEAEQEAALKALENPQKP